MDYGASIIAIDYGDRMKAWSTSNPQVISNSNLRGSKVLGQSIMIVETRVLSDSVLHPPYPTMRLEGGIRWLVTSSTQSPPQK